MGRVTEQEYLSALELINRYKLQIIEETNDAVSTYNKNNPIFYFPVETHEEGLLTDLVNALEKEIFRHPRHYGFELPKDFSPSYKIKVSDLENIKQRLLKRHIGYGKNKNRMDLLLRICKESNVKFNP